MRPPCVIVLRRHRFTKQTLETIHASGYTESVKRAWRVVTAGGVSREYHRHPFCVEHYLWNTVLPLPSPPSHPIPLWGYNGNAIHLSNEHFSQQPDIDEEHCHLLLSRRARPLPRAARWKMRDGSLVRLVRLPDFLAAAPWPPIGTGEVPADPATSLRWLTENPGRQGMLTGSFHPLVGDTEWEDQACPTLPRLAPGSHSEEYRSHDT